MGVLKGLAIWTRREVAVSDGEFKDGGRKAAALEKGLKPATIMGCLSRERTRLSMSLKPMSRWKWRRPGDGIPGESGSLGVIRISEARRTGAGAYTLRARCRA